MDAARGPRAPSERWGWLRALALRDSPDRPPRPALLDALGDFVDPGQRLEAAAAAAGCSIDALERARPDPAIPPEPRVLARWLEIFPGLPGPSPFVDAWWRRDATVYELPRPALLRWLHTADVVPQQVVDRLPAEALALLGPAALTVLAAHSSSPSVARACASWAARLLPPGSAV